MFNSGGHLGEFEQFREFQLKATASADNKR